MPVALTSLLAAFAICVLQVIVVEEKKEKKEDKKDDMVGFLCITKLAVLRAESRLVCQVIENAHISIDHDYAVSWKIQVLVSQPTHSTEVHSTVAACTECSACANLDLSRGLVSCFS